MTGYPQTNQAASLQLLQSWDRQRGLARLEEQSHMSCGARDVPRLLLGRLRVNIREVSPGGWCNAVRLPERLRRLCPWRCPGQDTADPKQPWQQLRDQTRALPRSLSPNPSLNRTGNQCKKRQIQD